MSDRSLEHLHPDLKPLCQAWLDKCHAQQIDARVCETYRSVSDQNKAYAVGRDASGKRVGKILTNAKGGQSPHNFTIDGKPASKAFDWFIQRPNGTANWDANSPEWKAAVAIGKAMGLEWGGDFSWHDNDHFQID